MLIYGHYGVSTHTDELKVLDQSLEGCFKAVRGLTALFALICYVLDTFHHVDRTCKSQGDLEI